MLPPLPIHQPIGHQAGPNYLQRDVNSDKHIQLADNVQPQVCGAANGLLYSLPPAPRAAPRHQQSQTMRCAWLAVETTQLRTCSASTQQNRTAMTACHDVTCFFADAMR
jgi:hypothetical protein